MRNTFLSRLGVCGAFWATSIAWFLFSIQWNSGVLKDGMAAMFVVLVLTVALILGVIGAYFTFHIQKNEPRSVGYRKSVWWVTLCINPPLLMLLWLFYKAREARPTIAEIIRGMVHE